MIAHTREIVSGVVMLGAAVLAGAPAWQPNPLWPPPAADHGADASATPDGACWCGCRSPPTAAVPYDAWRDAAQRSALADALHDPAGKVN